MTSFDVAHIREQGIDLIIVPLDPSFEYEIGTEQNRIINSIELCAHNAGLVGTVVPVWELNGQMRFKAPQEWHPFFRSIDMHFILRNINRQLTCG